ncbi:dimethylsulfonioproprionate lyase family protein [Gluconacetobacter tumulisoli]|uniref:Transcriptional regulator n=1 Tax=Gluconacetobacter tumulisoli TaxID=1286189 RepID=A0A7W4K994_9PROT|nr:dimethylsulfonioproprionate lyase family protein [Gluconacetobacter tumulisoli]MBB2202637.1 transcriptional regulator [Gluconacetobacter tumulisoli]
MSLRSSDIAAVLTAAEASVHAGGGSAAALAAADRIFTGSRTGSGLSVSVDPARLPVCRYFDAAIARAGAHPGISGRLAEAVAAVEPRLNWRTRPGAQGAAFLEGHANAIIVGPGGLEERNDILIGVSLVAPGTLYPDHHHPPEEVYVVLSDGEWRQGTGPWHAPGTGGIVYNPPNIVHAMRSGQDPLLALWCLWIASNDAALAAP